MCFLFSTFIHQSSILSTLPRKSSVESKGVSWSNRTSKCPRFSRWILIIQNDWRYFLINHSNHSFFRRELAADLVTLAIVPSAADFTPDNNFSVKVFPPKTKARTTTTRIRVRGSAIIGEENHKRTSSIAAIPNKASAQVGIDAE